jgi:hypothetical protein
VEITCRDTEEADNKKQEANFGGRDDDTGLVRWNLQPQNKAMHKLGVLQINVYQQSIYIQKYCKSSIWIYNIKDTSEHIIPNMGYKSFER